MADTRSTPLVTLNHCRNDQRVTISSLQAEFRQYQTEMLEAKKMTTMAETRSAAATRSQANASQIYKPTSERDESTSAILLLRTEFNEFKNEMREMLNTLLTSRQPYAGTQTWDEVKKENPDSDFKENSNILGAEGKKSYEEKHQADKEAYLQVITNEKREREAMKLLEDEQKQKTATELFDQSLHFVQEAEQDNKKKAKKIKDPLKTNYQRERGRNNTANSLVYDQEFFYGSLPRPPELKFSNLKP